MLLRIDPAGTIHCLYGEALDLASLGVLSIRRASHVEPDESGAWWADLSPVQGPRLGPYAFRSDALDAEVAWLQRNWRESPAISVGPEDRA
jgi:hypothetical protein